MSDIILPPSVMAGQLLSTANNVAVPSATQNFVIPESGGGSPVDSTWDFNSGSNGVKANGSDAFSEAFQYTQYSREVAAAEGPQCCKFSIPAGSNGYGQWGGIRNLPRRVGANEEYWMSIKVWHPNGFDFSSNSHLGIKHLRIRRTFDDNSSNIDGYFDFLISNDGYSVGLETGEFSSKYPNNWGLAEDPVRGRWNTMEMYSNLKNGSTGTIRWWLNGNLIFTASDIETLRAGTSCDAFYFLTYWNDDASNIQAQSCWGDNMRFTTTQPTNQDAQGNYMIGV